MKSISLFTILAVPALFFASCGSPDGTEATVAEPTAAAEAPAAATYQVDTQASNLEWKGSKVTGASHNGTVKLSNGELKVEGGQLVGGNFTIDMTSLDNTDLQGKDGYDKLVGHLKSDDFFGVEAHPTATFEITGVAAKDGDANATHDISGNLTIKGITKNLTFPAKVNVDANSTSATASFYFDRSLYDVKFGSTNFFENLGDNAINNEIELKVDLKANAATAGM